MKFKQIPTTILLVTILLCSGCGESEKTLLSKAQKKVNELQIQVDKAKEDLKDIKKKQITLERQKKDEIDKLKPEITMLDRLPYMVKYCLEKSSPYRYGVNFFQLDDIEIIETAVFTRHDDDTSRILGLVIQGRLTKRNETGERRRRESLDIKSIHTQQCSFKFRIQIYNSKGKCISSLSSNPFYLNPTGQGGSFKVTLPITDEYKGTNRIEFPMVDEIHRIEIDLCCWETFHDIFSNRIVRDYHKTDPQVVDTDLLKPLKYYK